MKFSANLLCLIFFSSTILANDFNSFEDLNPFSLTIEKQLQELDIEYQRVTGKNPMQSNDRISRCEEKDCPLYIEIRKSKQELKLYINNDREYKWSVSSGIGAFETPDFNRHPNGRMYEAYTSSKYPGGDYQGLGNMPYAIFISGGFAIHGTPKNNWSLLGQKASHGCIRIHPDNAKLLFSLVKQYGIGETWIRVRD